jgi:hypothetical protein
VQTGRQLGRVGHDGEPERTADDRQATRRSCCRVGDAVEETAERAARRAPAAVRAQ